MPTGIGEKVRAILFKRDTPLAIPALQSTDDQWIWSALDIARRAALADGLTHVPSIKSIADIFTGMLEQVQGMQRRDDFCVITTEIGNLIQSVVQHAREHGSACEKYRGVCDSFLSTISSMQSEMEQIFCKSGTSARSLKALKAYQGILSSYQFPLRRLRSDLQALALSSPTIPSHRSTLVDFSLPEIIQGDRLGLSFS